MLYSKIRPDLILHYTIKLNIYGTIAAGILNIKSINVITGLGYVFLKKGILSIIVKILYKFAFKFSSVVIFQNKEDYEFLIQRKIVSKEKARIIESSGIDTSYFSPNFCVQSKIKRYKDFTFMLISRMLWDKGIKEFVEAARILKKKRKRINFILVGSVDEGNPSGIPEKVIHNWEKEGVIKFKGFQKDIRKEICKADVIVLPSYREGIPRILLEACAMEKPVITTNTPGCREVVENGVNGFLVEPRDGGSLLKAMEKMLNLPVSKLREMGKQGRKMVIKRFKIESINSKYIEIINKIMKKK